MRTRNPNYGRARDTALGRVSPRRSGSRGITFRDSTTEAHPVVDLTVVGGTITDNDDGTAILTIDGSGVTVVGAVAPPVGWTPFDVSSGTDHRAFPGAAWIDNPTATEHSVGDRFLIVYRHGSSHLTNGKIVGKIATVTATTPWTYTLGSAFDIEDVANDLRVDDGVSVLDIGGGDYRAVIAAREYSGAVNHSPHVLICNTASSSMTSGSTWTRYNVALSGHTQDLNVNRVLKLQSGSYLMSAIYLSGGITTATTLKSSSITDWSAPTRVDIAAGYNEIDIEEMPDGTLFVHMRDVADNFHFSSTSTNAGATWSAPVNRYAANYFPTWRRLSSGIGFAVHASDDGSFDTAWRQTPTADTDTGWGSETILLSDAATSSSYATILQLDDTHVLVIYGIESAGADPTDSDLYSVVFTDSSVIGTTSSGITVKDEGTALATNATSLNFVGIGVVASGTGSAKTITVTATSTVYEPLTSGASSAPELVFDMDGRCIMVPTT